MSDKRSQLQLPRRSNHYMKVRDICPAKETGKGSSSKIHYHPFSPASTCPLFLEPRKSGRGEEDTGEFIPVSVAEYRIYQYIRRS